MWKLLHQFVLCRSRSVLQLTKIWFIGCISEAWSRQAKCTTRTWRCQHKNSAAGRRFKNEGCRPGARIRKKRLRISFKNWTFTKRHEKSNILFLNCKSRFSSKVSIIFDCFRWFWVRFWNTTIINFHKQFCLKILCLWNVLRKCVCILCKGC